MDGIDENAETSQQDIPKVPIKTYRWEDVRRSRRRGAYPWTHLTKPPFDEEADPEEYTMDAFRRSRSTSTIGKSETQEVSEVEEDIEMKEEVETHKPANGLPEDKENIKPTKSEEPSTSKGGIKAANPSQNNNNGGRSRSEEPGKKRKLSLESSVSKISLSKQALIDKLKDAKSKLKVPKLPKRSKSDAATAKQTKKQKTASTETKRSPMMPPLKDESPVYIHIPLKPPPGETDEFSKLEFESPSHSRSGSLTNLPEIGQGRRKMSLLGLLTELKKVSEHQRLANEARRVSQTGGESPLKQIIRLRPDDDSKIETGDVQSNKDKVGKKEPTSETEESVDSVTSEPNKLAVGKPRVQRKESDRLVIEEITDDDRKSNRSTEDSKPESERTHKPRTPEPIVVEPDESSADDNISQYLDKEDKCEIVSEKSATVSSENITQAGSSKTEEPVKDIKPQETPETSKADPEKAVKLEATLSKWKKQLPPVSTPQAATKESSTLRAKSEEPKRKRRSSIDSSYSRKSLSKLAFIKKMKEAKDKIKLPKFPSFAKGDKKDSKKASTKKSDAGKSVKSDKIAPTKEQTKPTEAPVYIHIPLKLPPGETDEFSHLADETEEKPAAEPVKKEVEKKEEESSVPPSPDTPDTPDYNVQLIILTPPSDDEILDSATIPDTPLESGKKFFENVKIDELKTLAKSALDTIYPDAPKLETVKEDEGSEQDASEAAREAQEKMESEKLEQDLPDEKKTLSQIQQQILVDEEDGLKLSDAAIAMINEEIAKELKEQELKSGLKSEASPSLKKKVSFKRRSRAEDGERIYEDVDLNASKANDPEEKNEAQEKTGRLESFQSMSVDEEKSYLDKKVIKTTSLEDDYNKWSKLNDHEYEPVNPPPEEMISRGPPPVVMTNNQTEKSAASTGSPERHFVRIPPDEELVVHGENDTPEENIDELGAQEVQRRIEDRYFNATPETTSSRTDGELNTSQVDSSALETLPLKKESRKKVASSKAEGSGKGFNETLRTQADKIKSKLQGIKRPNITLPQRPKFSTAKFKKPNFKKPNFKMPKMPDRPSINLPSFNLSRKDSSKDSWRERQFSTESNAGDSKKKIFDFRTYPRIFDRSKKNKDKESSHSQDRAPTPPPPEFATVPRVGRKKAPVGSRWTNKFKDIKYADEDARKSKEFDDEENQDVIRIPLHPDDEVPMDVPSHTRYNEDIDIDDDFDRENRDIHRVSPFSKDYLRRWNHGEFHEGPLSHDLQNTQEFDRGAYKITDLDNDTPPRGSFDMGMPHPKEDHSSGSLSEHRQGVLEEIDSDEFFLREKGISQDNIEVGKYLSSEIREAFRNPVNALSQLQSEDREYDLDASDQSEPLADVPRKKPLRKPKRKKTPTTSKEQIAYDQESITTEPEEYPKRFDEFKRYAPPPARPKRRSKKGKKKKPVTDDVVPFQETIPIEEQFQSFAPDEYTLEMMEGSGILPDNILGNGQQRYYDKDFPQMYENEHMKGIEQPEIKVSDPYYRYENFQHDIGKFVQDQAPPTAPTRKHRSLKSLNASEQDSIEIPEQNVEAYRAEQEYIIPTPEPPARPKRIRSRTQSQSGEDDRTSRGAESLVSDNQVEVVEVVEEPCVLDVRDTSGYAVIDKSRAREPPLPPSRFPTTPPRTRRARKPKAQAENKFATTPRPLSNAPPVRPLRNYSTLGGSSRASRSMTPSNEEEKENLDLSQYSEIDGEPVRRLHSGDVIQKMKDRPLPAPPRPPRRPRGSMREIFRDISHERNLPSGTQTDSDKAPLEETEILTQTETLTSGFDEQQMHGDRTLVHDAVIADIERQILPFDHEETITHGSLVVQPIDNAQILPHSQISNIGRRTTGQTPIERIIPVTQERAVDVPPTKYEKVYDDEETSEIPEEFTKLKSPPTYEPAPPSEVKLQQPPSQKQGTPLQENQEVGVLKARKLQVIDLDVDKLRVNELQASKIVVSELDGVSLQVSEINSKSGNLVLSGIELPPHLIQEMLDRLQAAAHEQAQSTADQSMSPQSSEATTQTVKPESATEEPESTTYVFDESSKIGKKKTPIEEQPLESSNFEEEAPPVPPRYDSKTDLLDENLGESKELQPELQEQECLEESALLQSTLEEETGAQQGPPVRPPRKSFQVERVNLNLEESDTLEAPSYLADHALQASQNLESSAVEESVEEVQREFSDSILQADNTSKSEEEVPPRPPQPNMQPESEYIFSQPPASFFALQSHQFVEFIEEDIPLPPRRKRHHKAPPVSRSSSEDVAPTPRRHPRSPEPSIPQLTGQLVRACATETNRSLKRLISHITNNVLQNTDGKQDLHVMILMLLILIAGLILLGDEKITIHHHHWEFFNPPRDL